MKTALIIGGTGLVGSQLLEILLKNSEYEKVISFVKRESGLKHPKLEEHIIDFDKIETYQDLVYGDDFFCTIGTTIKKAGTKEAFKKVDFEYPQQFAKIAIQNKVKQFLIVSSIGADSGSSSFYLKTKGEIEDFLKNCAFENVSILRPSALLGKRNEFRLGERFMLFIMKMLSFLFVGNLQKYKAIESKTVAEALFKIAQKSNKGFQIYKSNTISKLVKN
ncbi:MAG: NAD(P)H-binding protein [Flavobacterium sp.]